MKKKCDKCDRPATIHLTEIIEGKKIEKHLCEQCATQEGIAVKANVPISQLLEDFVLQSAPSEPGPVEQSCEICGMRFSEFRESGLLGCPNDYDAFGDDLGDIIRRSQEGAEQHVGKVPHRAGAAQQRQNAILRLRAELKQAIQNEEYERAAVLRDQIKDAESE